MTMSMARLSAQSGLKYLFKSTMMDDIDRTPPDTVSYYMKSGTPQGRWLGSGLNGIDRSAGDKVTESDAKAIFEQAAHPDTGATLGRPHGEPTVVQRRQGLPETRHAVAGFDLTFSVPKSVSALWALSTRHVQDQILQAHHEAVQESLHWLEQLVIHTRAGRNGIARVGTHGAIAAAFDHWESRSGDPQLHTHVVIANRVQRITDDAWVTLDSRSLYKAVVAASEHYNGLLFDALHQSLQTETDIRIPAQSTHNLSQQLTGIDDALIREFSNRSRLIDVETDRLVAEWIEEHGSRPTATTTVKLRQQATLSTRTPKGDVGAPLHELSANWRKRAKARGLDPEAVVAATINRSRHAPFHRGDLTPDWIDAVALVTRQRVAAKRSTWNRWNLIAEGERICAEIRCATAVDRNALIDAVASAAERQSVPLNGYRYTTPLDAKPDLRFANGSVFEFHGSRLFTDEATLSFEDEILAARNDDGGPVVRGIVTMDVLASHRTRGGLELHQDQRAAAAQVLLSGNRLDAIVGPAGTGKTTALDAIKSAWEAEFGTGSVVGLAPAAASAEVLAHELAMTTENVAKWLHESVGTGAMQRAASFSEAEKRLGSLPHDKFAGATRLVQVVARLCAEQYRWRFRPRQLVIIDEASMVSTAQLAGLVRQARESDAKILLVGDPGQLDSIDAGGVLGWLDRQNKTARLSTIWRFRQAWEQTASLRLRDGDKSVLMDYERNGRIRHGTYLDMLDRAYSGWHEDVLSGRLSILIAPDNDTVGMLNERAQADRVVQGTVDAEKTLALRDGLRAGRGDIIIARRNDRSILDDHGAFIRNGAVLEVTDVGTGQVRAIRRDTGASITLDASYLETSVELGYATTAHRSQGLTVDTGHTVVTPGRLTRELLYVSMTRGRSANMAYVSENDPDEEETLDPRLRSTWRQILGEVLAAEGAERSAHEVQAAERAHADSLERLSREYDYLAQIAAGLDLARVVAELAPEEAKALRISPSWGAAVASWRRATNVSRTSADRVLRELFTSQDGARDLAAIVHSRLRRLSSGMPLASFDALNEDLVVERADLNAMLTQVKHRIHDRIELIGNAALFEEPEWKMDLLAQLGADVDPYECASLVRDVAVYRDRWGIADSDLAIGTIPDEYEWEQRLQWETLQRTIREVARIPAIDAGEFVDQRVALTNVGWQL
ncbi:MobF family relaxase [Paenarthrobacter sp. RAF54_2]|uniref:MobF family relaxase n=1 Tax=Paenarthrobacter sp. RAF54_2 TaxID=3233061 RepID=UPI003F9A982B